MGGIFRSDPSGRTSGGLCKCGDGIAQTVQRNADTEPTMEEKQNNRQTHSQSESERHDSKNIPGPRHQGTDEVLLRTLQ